MRTAYEDSQGTILEEYYALNFRAAILLVATKEFDEKWGDPKLFVQVSYRGLWLHVRELGGIV